MWVQDNRQTSRVVEHSSPQWKRKAHTHRETKKSEHWTFPSSATCESLSLRHEKMAIELKRETPVAMVMDSQRIAPLRDRFFCPLSVPLLSSVFWKFLPDYFCAPLRCTNVKNNKAAPATRSRFSTLSVSFAFASVRDVAFPTLPFISTSSSLHSSSVMLVEGIDDEVLFTVGCLCLLVIAVLVKIGIGQSGETVRPARRPTPAPQPSSTDDRAPVQPGRYGNVPSQESGDRSSTQGRDESVRPTVVPPSGEQERANAYGPASASDIDVVIKTVVPESQTVVACPPRQTILFLKR